MFETLPDRDRKRTVKSINVIGVSEQVKAEILSRVTLRVGASVSPDEAVSLLQSVREYDEHLSTNVNFAGPDELVVNIVAPMSAAPRATLDASGAIKVGGNVQASKIVRQPRPVYPMEAKAARIQGVVKLMALIAKDGTIKSLEVISGHPILVPAALESVKDWVYQTTLFNGEPVEVQTQIDINFTLSQ
jgi:TonB family protein